MGILHVYPTHSPTRSSCKGCVGAAEPLPKGRARSASPEQPGPAGLPLKNQSSFQIGMPAGCTQRITPTLESSPFHADILPMYTDLKLGFLGFGKMAQAIARGLMVKNSNLNLNFYDVRKPFSETDPVATSFQLSESATELEEKSDLVLLCVKPQDMSAALKSLKGNKKYISIAAGTNLDSIRGYFKQGQSVSIARVMPNISATIGSSVSGIYCADPILLELAREIFNDVGFAIEVPKEDLLHAVTGLSGSGPAFVFAFIQGLTEGGVLAGLPYDTALQLANHTVKGAAEMLIELEQHPGVLRNQVTSPGGTTIAGLNHLEKNAFSGNVMGAVKAATDRSRELE